jgi:uncharacterized membrane protein
MKSKLGLVFLLLAYGFLSYLLLLISLQYVPYNTDVAFLRIKQDVIGFTYYKLAFFVHVYSSVFLLVFGLIQFFTIKKRTFVHRLSGRLYVGIILLLSGPSAFVMAIHANGGWIAQTSFLLLAVLWMLFTYLSLYYILKKDVVKHKKFAMRSFALTLSAMSLRLLKLGIVSVVALPPMDVYRIVSWSSWILNLIIVEIIIYRWFRKL